jgi:CRP-like cAMP-binding protein
LFEKYLEVLSQSSLFNGIDKGDLYSLLDCLNPKICYFKKNEFITMAGQKFDCVGIVLKGEAIVNKENAAGNRTIMTILKPGDMFGEVVVFSKQSLWPVNVQAQEACDILFLPRVRITVQCKKVCPWHRTIIQNMLKIVSERAYMLNRKVEYLSIYSIREKISTFLLEHYKREGNATFMLPMNRKEMAEFLNVSRPSLSREMCRMRDEGIIDFHLSSIKIIDLDKLKKMEKW